MLVDLCIIWRLCLVLSKLHALAELQADRHRQEIVDEAFHLTGLFDEITL